MLHGSLSRVVGVGLLILAGMSVGCGDSPTPSAPTPVAPPVTFTGVTVRSVAPSAGPTIGSDFIQVVGEGFQSGATVLIDGVAARVTRATSTTIDARTLAHAAGPADLTVVNPDGRTATLNAAYTFAEFS